MRRFLKSSVPETGMKIKYMYPYIGGFPGGARGKESTYKYRSRKRHSFHPWVRKIPSRKKWQPTPVFLPWKFHGQRRLVGYRVRHGLQSDLTDHTQTHTHMNIDTYFPAQPSTLWWPREAGGSRGRCYVYNCGWFALLYSRSQHNPVQQFFTN